MQLIILLYQLGNDQERFINHTQKCLFRPSIQNIISLNHILSPSKIDFLHYEYFFNTPLQDSTVNTLSFAWGHLTGNYILQAKEINLLELLINRKKPINPAAQNIQMISSAADPKPQSNKTQHTITKVTRDILPKQINVPTHIQVPGIQSIYNNLSSQKRQIKCHLCQLAFSGDSKLSEIMKHIKLIHKLTNTHELNAALIKHILPQIKSITIQEIKNSQTQRIDTFKPNNVISILQPTTVKKIVVLSKVVDSEGNPATSQPNHYADPSKTNIILIIKLNGLLNGLLNL